MSNAQLMNPNWFTGLIADALQSVTEKNSVLLVYIYDDSDRSEQFDAAFASEKVSVVMGQKTVSLKFMKESSNAMLFAQIYPVSKVPVVYFIVQGTIKDFLTEAPSAADIIDKINAVYSSIPDKTEKATQSAKEGQKKIAKRRETSKPSIEKVEYCNLKIKQLDGSTSDKLLLVTEWIDQFRTDGDRPYKLFIQFPTKEFDIGDEQRTLYELKLCPNSTLLMKPIKNVSTAYAKHSGNTSQKGWLSYIYTAGNSMYQSVSQASESIVFYFAPTSHQIPEPPQRLGNGEPFTANQNLYNGYQPNLNTLQGITNDERDSRKKDHKVYNGNSINQE
ncbi:hypothetical protein BDF20DRAFT_917395 [Mycotypha africana]|uniref:uncharacterized protein n=1 Tax=Mycotypha africana TaxID=64632 RepID=UPI0023015761|nr:uncharacterized protein BDF20DRAFT_917395 [Mycotypha africana]KAI8967798.1 hypothetical protein BDF20DRAFT_917395 [Mycotypha africana]